MPAAFRRVIALVDWNSQIRNCKALSIEDMERQASTTLTMTARAIGRALTALEEGTRYRVSLRLYHGWRKGFEETDRKRAATAAIAAADFATLSTSATVVIEDNVGFGDLLLDALPRREVGKPSVHLPGTYRRAERRAGFEEKMVDTAIAADLLSIARSDPDSVVMVVAEDTDLVPPLFTAEAWMSASGGRAFLLRAGHGGRSLALDDMALKGNWHGRVRTAA
ncbi:NYN domain-containing protein [Sphingomonas sp. 2SG]|uniref:NYN domain-containing protein n=1 Tax=Sphingomonas sp. 2SG TaxID=2502201 RepID=UPI0010F9D200|nr:NYN domain-containing protein [Sphingomonas sp. 2SG]